MTSSALDRLRARVSDPWRAYLREVHSESTISESELLAFLNTGDDSSTEEQAEAVPPYRCDWPNCKRSPFVEVYPIEGGWNYLCRWHFYFDRLSFIARIRAYPNLWCTAEGI